MSYITPENRQELLDVLSRLAKQHVDKEGAMCTAFVVSSEWVSSDGEYYIMTLTDNDSPPWRHEGLLQYTIANEIYDTEEEGEE